MNSLRFNQLGSSFALTAAVALGATACSDGAPNDQPSASRNSTPCNTSNLNPTTEQYCDIPENARKHFIKVARDSFLIAKIIDGETVNSIIVEKDDLFTVDCAIQRTIDPGYDESLDTYYRISSPDEYDGYYASSRMVKDEGEIGERYSKVDPNIPNCSFIAS